MNTPEIKFNGPSPSKETRPAMRRRFSSFSAGGVVILTVVFALGWYIGTHAQPENAPALATAAKKSAPAKLAPLKAQFGPQGIAWDLKSPLADILKKYAGGARIEAIVKLVDGTPVSDLHHLLDLAEVCPDSNMRKLVDDLAYSKWVATDPKGAVAYAIGMGAREFKGGGSPDSDALNIVFSAWAGIDPKAALAAAQALGSRDLSETETATVFSNWLESGNPADALAALKQIGHGHIDDYLGREFFDKWSQVDPTAAWAEVNQIDSAATRDAVRNLILRNMALSDPKGAFALLQSSPDAMVNPATYSTLFQAWAEQDPSAALAAAQQLPAGDLRTGALIATLHAWADSDPLDALKTAQGLSEGGDLSVTNGKYTILAEAMTKLIFQNPLAATDYINSVTDASLRNYLVPIMILTWTDSDPAAAFTWLQAHPADANVSLEREVIADVSAIDLQAGLSDAAQMPAGPDRDTVLNAVVGNWAKQDPSGALAWVKANLQGDSEVTVLAGIATSISNSDPVGAANILGQLPQSPARDNALVSLAGSLSKTDLQSAAQLLQALPTDFPAVDRTKAYETVMKNWAAVDVADAAAFLQSQAGDPALSQTFGIIAGTWAGQNPQAALQWAASLPPGQNRDGAMDNSVLVLAMADPAAAQAYVASLPPGTTSDDEKLTDEVIDGWSRKDPATAAGLLNSIPPETLSGNPDVVSRVAYFWARVNSADAVDWTASLPAGPIRDQAIKGLDVDNTLSGQNPAEGFQLALGISNATLQITQLTKVYKLWLQKDPVAAANALQSAPLTDQQRAQIQAAH